MQRERDIASEVSSLGVILMMLAIAALARMPGPLETENLSAAQVPAHVPPAYISTEAQRLRDGKPMRINRANEDDLVLLPGVGIARARAIIAYRNAHGAFHNAMDLTLVTGLGTRSVAKLEHLITFE